jgi:hypothetical protein
MPGVMREGTMKPLRRGDEAMHQWNRSYIGRVAGYKNCNGLLYAEVPPDLVFLANRYTGRP